jgi:hypothetical protein
MYGLWTFRPSKHDVMDCFVFKLERSLLVKRKAGLVTDVD